jgi:hypothetical protein
MSINEMNAKLQNATVIICPWTDAFSNQCKVQVKAVAGNRTVTYTWESLDEQMVKKTAQVSYSTWNHIVQSLSK